LVKGGAKFGDQGFRRGMDADFVEKVFCAMKFAGLLECCYSAFERWAQFVQALHFSKESGVVDGKQRFSGELGCQTIQKAQRTRLVVRNDKIHNQRTSRLLQFTPIASKGRKVDLLSMLSQKPVETPKPTPKPVAPSIPETPVSEAADKYQQGIPRGWLAAGVAVFSGLVIAAWETVVKVTGLISPWW
jgi:hypothetical protein